MRRGGKQVDDRLRRSDVSRIVHRQASVAIRPGGIRASFEEKTDDWQALPHDGVEQRAGLLITCGIGICPVSHKRLHGVRIAPSAHRVKHGIPEAIALIDRAEADVRTESRSLDGRCTEQFTDKSRLSLGRWRIFENAASACRSTRMTRRY
jgi:hypothetical protein